MPQIPSPFPEKALLKDLPKGTLLTITKAVPEKTEKNGYHGVTLTDIEKGDLFALDSGVLYNLAKLTGVEKLPSTKTEEFFELLTKGCKTISALDPLKVVVSTYKSARDGEMRYTIKNQVS